MKRKLINLLRFTQADRQGVATLAHRHIYILPTRYGVFFGVLLATMLLGSMNYANNLGFMTTFLLAGLGLVAMLHTYRNQIGLKIARGRAEAVFAGQAASFEVQIKNLRKGPRPGIRVQAGKTVLAATDLEPQQTQVVRLGKPAEKRGELPLGRIVVSTYFPLGLFRTWSYVELDFHCLVYPAPAPEVEIPTAPSYASSHSGDKGVGTDDFLGLRQYRPGDSPRHIDWKALARERGLLTRQFGGDRADQLWLDWSALPDQDVETRLSLLCRCVLTVSERQQTYGMRLPGLEIPLGRGAAHQGRCLEALARFEVRHGG
jgi:uncharacterized protein (DUF58 family)